jgi:putative MATE family efflux protein
VQALWLAVAVGVMLTVSGIVLAPAAVGLMGASGPVRSHALTYLRISLLGAPAVLVALVGVGYLRGIQDIRTTLTVAVCSNVANLVLELVLVYGLGAGIAGSAWATVVCQVGAAGAYLRLVVAPARAAGTPVAPQWGRIRSQLVVGRALVVRTASLLGALAVATAVASRLGPVELGSHQIAFQIWSFLALVLDAIAIAGQAMIGRLLGAGEPAQARAAARRMIEWGVAGGVVFAIAVAASRSLLVPLFTADERVADLASGVLLVVAALQPLNAIVFVLDGVLIGAGDLRYLAAAMVVSGLAVFVPAALAVLWLDLGLPALWGALALLMVARAVANCARFAGPGWQVVGGERPAG